MPTTFADVGSYCKKIQENFIVSNAEIISGYKIGLNFQHPMNYYGGS